MSPILSAAEFADRREPDNGTHEELVRGRILVKPVPGLQSGAATASIGFLLAFHLQEWDVGRVVGRCGVITTRDPDSVRGPPVSFYSYERVPKLPAVIGWAPVPPDLCIEIKSPSNSVPELHDKAREYPAAGVRMVWIADPAHRTLTVITDALEARTYEAAATLNGGDVLPGFTCVVSELFE